MLLLNNIIGNHTARLKKDDSVCGGRHERGGHLGDTSRTAKCKINNPSYIKLNVDELTLQNSQVASTILK